jgi:hypothetical protein
MRKSHSISSILPDSNSGTIIGMAGADGSGGAGGVGVVLPATSKGTDYVNTGLIEGGDGGKGTYYQAGGAGGVGVMAAAGTLTNSGKIFGGYGAYGGNRASGGDGGTGVSAMNATVTNTGQITGGQGGQGNYAGGGNGGTGIYLKNARLLQSGTVTGGGGGYGYGSGSGGAGIIAVGGSLAVSAEGHVGGGGGNSGSVDVQESIFIPGGSGGVGISLTGSTLSVSGTVTGGRGGYVAVGYSGGAGGDGIDLNGGKLTVSGTVSGGAGGNGTSTDGTIYYGGGGGAGIAIGSGTVIVSGTVSGGAAGAYSNPFFPQMGDAIVFDGAAGTLVVEAGATFNGAVTANSAAADVLILGAKGGTLSGLGSQFTGFNSISELSGTAWTLDGANTVSAGESLSVVGTLNVGGALTDNGRITVARNATLNLQDGGTFGGVLGGLGAVTISNGLTLMHGSALGVGTVTDTGNLTLGSGEVLLNPKGDLLKLSSAPASGTLAVTGAQGDALSNQGSLGLSGPGSIEISVTFTNFGRLSQTGGTLAFLGAIGNNGTITVASGTAIVSQHVSGAGAFQIGAAGTLSLLSGAASTQSVDFLAAAGQLDLTYPARFLGTIAGFHGQDSIDLVGTALPSLSFANNVLTVLRGGTVEASLHFAPGLSLSDFTVGSDGHGGTVIGFR